MHRTQRASVSYHVVSADEDGGDVFSLFLPLISLVVNDVSQAECVRDGLSPEL